MNMTIEVRPNQLRTNGVHPAQSETLVPPPFVFPDGTTLQVIDVERKLAETLINAKEVYLNAQKTDPNAKEQDYILSKPELCHRIYPGIAFRVASNDLDVAFKALRNDMYKQAVPWQLITVTPKLGEPSTYDLVKVKEQSKKIGVSQPIPVESKNGKQTTQLPPPPQSESNGKTPESQSRVELGRTEKRPFTHKDIAKICDRSLNSVQSKTSGIREKEPGFGELIGGVRHYSQMEVERLVEELKESSLSSKDMQAAKIAKKDRQKRKRRERGEARIDQASQPERVSADFTDAILNYLAMSSPYANPLDSLDRDLSLSSFLIYSSNGSRRSIEELKEKYTTKQIETFIVSSFIKKVEEMLNDKNAIQKHSVESPLRISQARRAVNKYGGIENLTMAIVEHFFVPLSRKQIVAILHLLRSVNA